jgi:hypothetical protein
MGTSRIPLEVDAPLGPRALDDLGMVLGELGYDARSAGRELGDGPRGGGGAPEISLKLGEAIPQDAANVLLEAVSNWIRQRPVQRGRFRQRKPRPVSVTISGPTGDVLFRTVVERS